MSFLISHCTTVTDTNIHKLAPAMRYRGDLFLNLSTLEGTGKGIGDNLKIKKVFRTIKIAIGPFLFQTTVDPLKILTRIIV